MPKGINMSSLMCCNLIQQWGSQTLIAVFTSSVNALGAGKTKQLEQVFKIPAF
jgi:hypothetical protein